MIESSTATRDPEDVTRDPPVEPLADRPVGHDGTRVEVGERWAWAVSGFLVLPAALVLAGVAVWQVVLAARAGIDGSPMGPYFEVAGWTGRVSSPWTRTARPRWCPTCSSCSAGISGPPRS